MTEDDQIADLEKRAQQLGEDMDALHKKDQPVSMAREKSLLANALSAVQKAIADIREKQRRAATKSDTLDLSNLSDEAIEALRKRLLEALK